VQLDGISARFLQIDQLAVDTILRVRVMLLKQLLDMARLEVVFLHYYAFYAVDLGQAAVLMMYPANIRFFTDVLGLKHMKSHG